MTTQGGLPSPRPGRVLIVDDHALMRHGLRELFRHYDDIEVCGEADSIEAAIEAVDATRPDLIIVDLTLRDGSGLALVERIRDDAPSVSALVWSMHDETLFASRAHRAGASAYVSKAAPTDDLIRAVRDVLSGRLAVDRTDGDTPVDRGGHDDDEEDSDARRSRRRSDARGDGG